MTASILSLWSLLTFWFFFAKCRTVDTWYLSIYCIYQCGNSRLGNFQCFEKTMKSRVLLPKSRSIVQKGVFMELKRETQLLGEFPRTRELGSSQQPPALGQGIFSPFISLPPGNTNWFGLLCPLLIGSSTSRHLIMGKLKMQLLF